MYKEICKIHTCITRRAFTSISGYGVVACTAISAWAGGTVVDVNLTTGTGKTEMEGIKISKLIYVTKFKIDNNLLEGSH